MELSIGDFARETGLTPKALRLYDELGLVRPVRVDPFNGYRWYSPVQVEQARLVASLRVIGMPLARIAAVLAAGPDGAPAEIASYWRQVEADTASRREIVRHLVASLRGEHHTMTSTTLHAEVGVSHRQGARERQQDAVLTTQGWYAVADGFGERDDLAGRVLEALSHEGYAAAERLARGDDTSGTTLTAVRLDGDRAWVTHIGDGRVYRVREGSTEQLTHDHTMVAALLEEGSLTPEEARVHPHRHLLNRALGTAEPDEIALDVLAADRLVLTTDGVHSVLEKEALWALFATIHDPQAAADAVASAVAAAGEPDNHTVVVVDLR